MPTYPPHSDHAPRIEFIARGLMVWGDRVLVCRNLKHGYGYLPGGHVEPDERAADACEREFLEETGLSVRAGRCLLVCEARFTQQGKRRHEVTAVFHVEHPHAGGSEEPPEVVSREAKIGFEWIARERVSAVDLRPVAMRSWLLGREWGGSSGDTSGPDWISVSE